MPGTIVPTSKKAEPPRAAKYGLAAAHRKKSLLTPDPASAFASRSFGQRNRAEKPPHLPERRVRLVQFRMLQVNLNIIERDFTDSDLGHLIPTIVLLPPAVQIP